MCRLLACRQHPTHQNIQSKDTPSTLLQREIALEQHRISAQNTAIAFIDDLPPLVVPPPAPMARELALRARPLLPLEASILDCLDEPKHEADGATNASETPEISVMTAASATHAADLHVDMLSRGGERSRNCRDQNCPVQTPDRPGRSSPLLQLGAPWIFYEGFLVILRRCKQGIKGMQACVKSLLQARPRKPHIPSIPPPPPSKPSLLSRSST